MGFCETTILASTVPARTKLAQSQEFLVYRPIYQVMSPPRGARASQFLHLAVVCRQSKGSGGSTMQHHAVRAQDAGEKVQRWPILKKEPALAERSHLWGDRLVVQDTV